MIVSRELWGIYGFLLSAQGTSCSKPRGSSWSSPLRSDGSWDAQAGEAGLLEQSSAEAKSLKLRAKGLLGCHPQWATAEAARWGSRGQIKNYSHDNLLKENKALSSSKFEVLERQKAACQRKHHGWKKGKDNNSRLQTCSCWGGGVDGDEVADEWEPGVPITSPCDSVTVSDFKPGKRGLNSQLRPVLRGVGNGSHTLPNHVTGNGRLTWHSRGVIKLRPDALLEMF
jgi:hypothetical protein